MSSARAVGSSPAAAIRLATSTPSERRLWRSIFRRCPKAAWVTASKVRRSQASGAARGRIRTTEDVTLGGGTNADALYVEEYPRFATPLHQHRQASVALGARFGNEAFSDFALEHEDRGIVPRRPWLGRDPSHEQSSRDVVGQVGDDAHRSIDAGAWIECERVSRYDVEPIGIAGGDLLQSRNGPLVALDCDDASGAERQQRAGQSPRPGADFEHGHAGKRPGRARDARRQVEIKEEVLPERFLGDEPVAANDFAQRRQSVWRGRHRAPSGAGAFAAASRAASRSAAMRLVGSARPVPAMSKAVPWSGEVRTKGRPSVTLTA